MYPTFYTVITLSGLGLYLGDNRYDADKALFAANESAQLRIKDSPEPGRVIADNFDVFPPEPVSAWIPVTSRLPEMTDFEVSEQVLFTDGVERYVGKYHSDADDWTPEDERRPRWIISGRDGYEVEGVTHWTTLPTLP